MHNKKDYVELTGARKKANMQNKKDYVELRGEMEKNQHVE